MQVIVLVWSGVVDRVAFVSERKYDEIREMLPESFKEENAIPTDLYTKINDLIKPHAIEFIPIYNE